MKIELVKKTDLDGIWYIVKKDDYPIRVFGVHNDLESDVLNKAMSYFNSLKENHEVYEIIRTAEL